MSLPACLPLPRTPQLSMHLPLFLPLRELNISLSKSPPKKAGRQLRSCSCVQLHICLILCGAAACNRLYGERKQSRILEVKRLPQSFDFLKKQFDSRQKKVQFVCVCVCLSFFFYYFLYVIKKKKSLYSFFIFFIYFCCYFCIRILFFCFITFFF